MKKGSVLAYGGLIAILVVGSFVVLYVTNTGDVSSTIATKEGQLISFENKNALVLKSFDTGLEFIAQRSAYELGKTGGLRYEEFWTTSSPKIDELKAELEKQIIENLPTSYKKDDIEVEWGQEDIQIRGYDDIPCGPLQNSRCFFIGGTRNFSVYDSSLRTRSTGEHKINSQIFSSYFRLLNAGRTILEDPKYNTILDQISTLEGMLNTDPQFFGLQFDLTADEIEDGLDIVHATITEVLCNIDYSCYAPLNSREIQALGQSYDHLSLHFSFEAEQTDDTGGFDFLIISQPDEGEGQEMCSM